MPQVITLSPLIVQGQNDDISLDEAIRREIARPAPDSLKLPEPAGEAVPPPPLIQQAGKDFVKAWQIWERVMAPSPAGGDPKSPSPTRKDLINTATEWEPFHALLTRCI